MTNLSPRLLLCLMFFLCSITCYSQTAFVSESIIKYDINTHTTDKPIPFDRAFTLEVPKMSTKDIVAIHGYEAKVIGGERILVENTFVKPLGYKICGTVILCKGDTLMTAAIKDVDLKRNPYGETLQIFFPALKPNVDFDVKIFYRLSSNCKDLLMKVNTQLSQNLDDSDVNVSDTYEIFKDCTIDELALSTGLTASYNDYLTFYKSNLVSHYKKISKADTIQNPGNLTLNQIQAIDRGITKEIADFQDGQYLFEASRRGLFKDLQMGIRNINTVFLPDSKAVTNFHAGHIRLQNLDSNIKFFDDLLKKLDRLISKEIISVLVDGRYISVDELRSETLLILDNLRRYYLHIGREMGQIVSKIDGNRELRQTLQLVGNTLSSDLKSAGKSLLFLDAGLANILAPNILNRVSYIPKLYWGISIYFRPIDKNTRRSRFPAKTDLKTQAGCRLVNGRLECGPDHSMLAKKTIWQHLSLNIGVTLGAMGNKEFDNFYNNTSLLIGPAYRFARAFKVSAGVALLRRTSKDPFVSDMKIIPGGYISASVDIDFIEGIKNVTSLFFK